MSKYVTGSNEHLCEIEGRIAALETGQGNAGAERGENAGRLETGLMQLQNSVSILTTKVSGLEGTLGTQQTIASNLQSEVSVLTARIEALQRVNPAG